MRDEIRTPAEPEGLLGDRRGAALVEFVIAVVPMLTTFFCFTQVAKIYTAQLVVQHAAISAARAAAVVSNVNDNNPGQNGSASDIKQAAGVALMPFVTSRSISNVNVTVSDQSTKSDPYGPVRVEVRATYRCTVPMAARIMCPGSRKFLTAEATMPHQGARYKVK